MFSESALNSLGGLIQAMTLADRIREAMDASGASNADIARAAGKTPGAVTQWLKGETKTLKAESAQGIEAATGFRASWLITGKGPKTVANTTKTENAGAVPLISWVQAGAWSQIVDNFQPGDAEDWLPCPVRHGPHTYVLTVKGASMYNPSGPVSFKEGDRIFVDPDRDAQHRSLVVVRRDAESEATFKQLLVEGDVRMLMALNPNWPDRIMKLDTDTVLCGVVIGRLEVFL